MDSWSKIQLARIRYGGNTKLRQFWKEQKFPNKLTSEQRLNNDAMDKYREVLLKRAKGLEESSLSIPFIGYKKRQIQQWKKFDSKSMEGFGNTQNVEEDHNVLSNYLIVIAAIVISYYVYKYLF